MKRENTFILLLAITLGVSAVSLSSCAVPPVPAAPAIAALATAERIPAQAFIDLWGRNCIETWSGGVDCDPVTATPGAPPIVSTPTQAATLPMPSATIPPTLAPSLTPFAPAVLINPGFESPPVPGGLAGWAVYHVVGGASFNVESLQSGADPRAVLEGEQSARFIIAGQYGVWRSGMFQRVRVGAGRSITFSASAYFKAGNAPGLEENRIREIYSTLRVGIDPNGGQSPASAGVAWSGRDGDFQWVQGSVSAVSAGEWVTMFIECGIGNEWSFPWSMAFIDGVTLAVR